MKRLLVAVMLASLTAACAPTGSDDTSQPGCSGVGSSASETTEANGAYNTEERGLLILAAQAVPSATLLPCVLTYPAGWTFAGWFAHNGSFGFWLDSDRAGIHAVEVELTASCDTGAAIEVAPSADESGTRRFEEPLSLPPTYAVDRYYTFDGGCVVYHYRFANTEDPALALEADQALGFRARAELVTDLEAIGLHLCGAGSPPCAGEE